MSTSASPRSEAGRAAIWIIFLSLAFWPRLFMLGFWIFGSQIGNAFSSWVIPVIGFFVAPSTTLAYAMAWSIDSNGVSGAEWLIVAAGALLDLWMWGAFQRIRED